jgi:transketolase
MEILSKLHAKNLVAWARERPRVLVLSADLTGSTEVDLFRDTYPDRFLSLGIAEQNMLAFAGGLAREGFEPFVHTFSVFIYRRALDQIAMSVAYPNLRVRMVGFLPGITTPGGATHQAIEDIAVMRVLPNMTVLECGDATEVESVLDVMHGVDGPVYVRMLRGEIPRLFDRSEPFALGRPRLLREGDDIALITSGICTEEAMRATRVLEDRGLSIGHLHVSTHKPFHARAVVEAASKARRGVITLENHVVTGGLGSAVAEALADAGAAKRLIRLGLKDTFAHGASRPYLMKKYGLDAMALVRAVEAMISKKLDIAEDELAAVRIEPAHSSAREEAL